ncbi:chromatin-associated protein [Sporothrix brasiliensis 5110]|uniref:Chromatin-associated protein n=1 Tax=Sporothrix brasiliensis 5110 TaxID=1398154 RepID=A0A0C2ENF8_9PEZI|nr:chromatin-associated protein [Sporothrix brasiliensis 5110]KIH87629.1 chromatin-associated protein [Sporothrix brasiliensis 5110]
MSQRLEDELEELQLTQYYDAFVDQGFDSWETLLDITESDLDALGVKLGHRRKLQRRIANYRGVAQDVSLVSPTRTPGEDSSRTDSTTKQEAPSNFNLDSRGAVPGVLAKRKYRRHPKPDENAPERPPSAYVLFSNKIREDLKGKNLSFTEIAKHVGENWQGLTAAEREPFETQAQLAKGKYNQDLAEYKKTDEYKQYMVYLQDFKAKHGGNQTQDNNAFKRIKLADFSTTNTPMLDGRFASPPTAQHHPDHGRSLHERHIKRNSEGLNDHGSQYGSESSRDIDSHHASGKRHIRSTASGSDCQYSASPSPGLMHSPTPLSHRKNDDAHSHDAHSYRSPSSRPASRSPHAHTATVLPPSHGQSTAIRRSESGGSAHMGLPSLSRMFHDNRHSHSPTTIGSMSGPRPDTGSNSPGMAPHSNHMMVSSSSASSASNVSNGSGTSSYSTASSNRSGSYPRTPLESSMPIHTLLSDTSKTLSPTSPHKSSASSYRAQPYSQSSWQHPLRPPSLTSWNYLQAKLPTEHGPVDKTSL